MKAIRISFLLISLFALAGCSTPTPTAAPSPTATPIPPTITPQPNITSTPKPAVTPQPTPIAKPHYEIGDSSTWTQEMQDYYNRAPAQWNNPTRAYMSDEAFNTQLVQMRREFLAEQNVAGVETMSESDLFTNYVRWGMEHGGQILRLSPLEKTRIMTGPFMPGYKLNGVRIPGIQIIQGYDQEPSQTRLDFLQSDEYAAMNNHLFGRETHFNRPAYDGTIATLVGLVEPIGVQPGAAIECLMYYEQAGQGYWALINVSFTPQHHLAGEDFIALENGYRTFTYTADNDGIPTWLGLGPGKPTLQNFIDNLGRRIWLKAGGAGTVSTAEGPIVSVATELTPVGIESAQAVIFDMQQPATPELPWDK